jgi:type I restriction enzyme S subunit
MVWKYKKLSEFAKVSSGGTPKKSKKDFWNGDIPWYSSGELNDFNTIAPKAFITESGLSGSSAKLFPKGSLLIGMYDTAALKMSILDREATFNQAIAGVKPNKEVSLSFILYAINSIKPELLKLRRGVRQKNLNQGMIKDILIPDIPLTEQKNIVTLLDTIFSDLEQTIAKTEQNLKNARELFDSYLQQVFSHKGDDWVKVELFDHIKFIDYRGKTPKKTESGLRLITAKNVRMGYLKPNPAEFVTPESYDDWMTRGIPKKGDVLFTSEAPLANVAQLDTDDKVVFAQRIITMQPDRSVINCDFLKYLLMSPPIQQRIIEKGTGATVTGIKASLLKKILIEFPSSIEEQSKYVITLNSLTDSVKQLEVIYQNKLTAIDELKKSILQKAFSGELTTTAN